MRRAAQIDANQQAIVKALREHGAMVRSLAPLGDGIPDLLVGYRGLTLLMEVKEPQSAFVRGGIGGKRERASDEYDPFAGFTLPELRFHRTWPGQPIIIARSIEDALKAIGAA